MSYASVVVCPEGLKRGGKHNIIFFLLHLSSFFLLDEISAYRNFPFSFSSSAFQSVSSSPLSRLFFAHPANERGEGGLLAFLFPNEQQSISLSM